MLAQWFLGMSKSSSKDTKKLHLVSYATFITFFSALPNTRTILQHAEFDRVVEISFAYKSCGSVLTINLSSFYCAFENRIWWFRRRLGGADNFLHISLQLSNNGLDIMTLEKFLRPELKFWPLSHKSSNQDFLIIRTHIVRLYIDIFHIRLH